jgi:superoxide dismutase
MDGYLVYEISYGNRLRSKQNNKGATMVEGQENEGKKGRLNEFSLIITFKDCAGLCLRIDEKEEDRFLDNSFFCPEHWTDNILCIVDIYKKRYYIDFSNVRYFYIQEIK